MTNTNRELDAKVAVARGLNVEWYHSTVTGNFVPYAVDRSAERTSEHSTRARYIGASWGKAKNENGEIIEFYGYVLPPFSSGIALAWSLVEEIENFPRETKRNDLPNVGKFDDDRWHCSVHIFNDGYYEEYCSHGAPTAPEAICRAYLKWKARE